MTAVGVTASVAQTYRTSVGGSGGPRQTGAGSGNEDGSGSGSGSTKEGANGGSGDESDSKGPSIPVIVGVAVGAIAGLALIAGLIFFLIRSARKRKALAPYPIPDGAPGDNSVPLGLYGGKAELPSDTVAAPPPPTSPSPSTLKANLSMRADTVSPVSAHTGAFTPPPNKAELHGQAALYPPMPNSAELQGQGPPSPFHGPVPNRPELQGQGAMYPPPPDRPELQGQGTQFHTPNPNRPELAGQYAYPQSPQLHQQHPQPYPSPPPPAQQQQMQGYQPYYPASPQPGAAMYGQQQQQPPHPQASWQSGPVPGFHEMDGGGYAGPR